MNNTPISSLPKPLLRLSGGARGDKALVVLSGGQDSTTCLFWAKHHFKEVYAISFVYGQKHSSEVKLAEEICRDYGVNFRVMDISFISQLNHNALTDTTIVMDQEKPEGALPNTFVPGRNLFFLSIAAVYAREIGAFDIVTGVSQTDFSGYTDSAIAIALLLGFRLPINFNSPYKSHNITEFWRRWHISLSSWLRDYLYISMGGNRKGTFRRYLNLFLTMLIGGLWHGANVRFVIWGGLHGLALIFDKLLHKLTDWFETKPLLRFVSLLVTFHFVCFCWIFFRADDTLTAFDMISKIFSPYTMEQISAVASSYWKPFVLIVVGFVIHWLPTRFKDALQKAFTSSPVVVQLLAAVLTAVLLYQFKSSDIQAFIYFQF